MNSTIQSVTTPKRAAAGKANISRHRPIADRACMIYSRRPENFVAAAQNFALVGKAADLG